MIVTEAQLAEIMEKLTASLAAFAAEMRLPDHGGAGRRR
jgi:hypothetical protein